MNKLQQRQLYDSLVERFGRGIADAFADAVQTHAASIPLADLVAAIEAGDLRALEALLRFPQGALFPLSEAMRTAFVGGGLAASTALGARFGFDGRNYRAEAWMRDNGGALIEGIQADTLQMVRQVMDNRLVTGESGAKTARSIVGTFNRATGRREGGFLGLTSQQTDWVINARNDLGNLDERYFTRALRDKRYDPMVRKAIKDRKPLAQADVDKILTRYKDRLLKYRGDVIARTEAHRATSAGTYEGMMQAKEQGLNVTIRWVHGFSREPRLDHLSAAQAPSRPIGVPFTMADGTQLLYPHDPKAPARHVVGCKCSAFYRVA
jgi:hypothetical protein